MIIARCIIEMVGSPKEYLDTTMKKFVEKIGKESGMKLLNSRIAEVVESGKLFSTFSELEIDFSSIDRLVAFCIDSMPSSVEILEPAELILGRDNLSNFFNDLQGKLHAVDMDLKLLTAKAGVLEKNSMMLFRNFVMFSLQHKSMTIGEMSNIVGIDEDSLQLFIDRMTEEKLIRLEKGVFVLGKGARKNS